MSQYVTAAFDDVPDSGRLLLYKLPMLTNGADGTGHTFRSGAGVSATHPQHLYQH